MQEIEFYSNQRSANRIVGKVTQLLGDATTQSFLVCLETVRQFKHGVDGYKTNEVITQGAIIERPTPDDRNLLCKTGVRDQQFNELETGQLDILDLNTKGLDVTGAICLDTANFNLFDENDQKIHLPFYTECTLIRVVTAQ